MAEKLLENRLLLKGAAMRKGLLAGRGKKCVAPVCASVSSRATKK
jgi:hypothetical protein